MKLSEKLGDSPELFHLFVNVTERSIYKFGEVEGRVGEGVLRREGGVKEKSVSIVQTKKFLGKDWGWGGGGQYTMIHATLLKFTPI